jgi:hypothetical protein
VSCVEPGLYEFTTHSSLSLSLSWIDSIDNIALTLAASGFLTERLEEVALAVRDTKLPKKHNVYYKALDSILFLSTFFILLSAWMVLTFVDFDVNKVTEV